MKVQVFDNSGKKVKEISAPKEVFDTPVNEHLIYEAVINYRANQRRGTAATKTRGTRATSQQMGCTLAMQAPSGSPNCSGNWDTNRTKNPLPPRKRSRNTTTNRKVGTSRIRKRPSRLPWRSGYPSMAKSKSKAKSPIRQVWWMESGM